MAELIARLDSAATDFTARFARLRTSQRDAAEDVTAAVRAIVADVRQRGDAALLEYTNRFDRRDVTSAVQLEITDCTAALERIAPAVRDALGEAAARIQEFHERQRQDSWRYTAADGTVLGQWITPLDRVGLYVPGGQAAYPSSVLMTAIPARVAGVREVIVVAPAPAGQLAPVVLAAAAIAGVDRVFTVGGAQAIAALAYGTETIPAVDKICGPGNRYVAAAKALVFGQVGIDMFAGPSEIAIVCDGLTEPDWIALDLMAQAEHDEQAQAILLAPDRAFLDRVAASIGRLLPTLERSAAIAGSLAARGALIAVRDLDEAIALVNQIAPEHLELSVADPDALLPSIRHAGAIFLGRHTSEALGDYCAGPSHVLPTAGSARFSSALGVPDFQKRGSLIGCTPASARRLGAIAEALGHAEGLTAHARSAAIRSGQ
ncbi:MAG: histidinol dehydrogenase [Gammaproteobacteria bacterium]|nr:histidinol dehydrogenase [Gammaproteobacteria bacterium]